MNLFFRSCKEDIDNVCVPTDEHYELPYKSETQQQPSILADSTGYQSDNLKLVVSEDFSSVGKYRQAVAIAKDEYAKALEVVGEEGKATWMAMKTQTSISSKHIACCFSFGSYHRLYSENLPESTPAEILAVARAEAVLRRSQLMYQQAQQGTLPQRYYSNSSHVM
jgi:hypothetical protein